MLLNNEKLQKGRFLDTLNEFFRSGWYLGCIVLCMVCSELCSLELYVIPIYLFLGVICILFCDDLLGVVPMASCSYMLFAAKNNPGKFPETGLFAQQYAQDLLFICICIAATVLVIRLVYDLLRKKERHGVPKLTAGYIALGIAYVLGGAFSGYYDTRTVFFGLVQIASVSVFYFYFYFTVNWRNVPRHYTALLVTLIGVGLFAQVLGMYFNPGAPSLDGSGDRGALYTGWGVWNCVGCMMAFCIPAPVYFAVTKKHGWRYTLLSTLFLLGVVLTQSRGSMLTGAIVYACGVAVTLVKSCKKERIYNLLVYACMLICGMVVVFLFRDKVGKLLSSLFGAGLSDNGRFDLYEEAIVSFLRYPLFGVGWYDVPGIQFAQGGMYPNGAPELENFFIPGFVHNTPLQLLAMGGALALACYLFHRVQTVALFLHQPTLAKTVSGICILAILIASLLDNHIFNMGPGLLYSILLVFAERAEGSKKREFLVVHR